MNFNGLSIEQAPPISAPLRFYLTAPLFAIIAGFLILFSDTTVLMSRYSIDSIIITHALTIGFLSFIMLGSLSQMLPVLAGVVIPKVDVVTKASHGLLVLGTVFMLLGLSYDNSLFNTISILGLGTGFFDYYWGYLHSNSKGAKFHGNCKSNGYKFVLCIFYSSYGLVFTL